jgi:hypothetical protein
MSPDGSRVAAGRIGGQAGMLDIWLIDPERLFDHRDDEPD